jgi:hypothetical protein
VRARKITNGPPYKKPRFRVAGQYCAQLAHLREGANLRLESLIVLTLDLKFRL